MHGGAQQLAQRQAEGQRRQPVCGGHPAPPPGQVGHAHRGGRQQHLPGAQRGNRGHRVVGQRVAQGQHGLVHGQVQPQRLAVRDHRHQQCEPAPAQQQQHQRQHRQRHRLAPLRVEHGHRVPAQGGVALRPAQQPGQPAVHARGRPAVAVQHDRPHRAHHHRDQAQHHHQSPGHRGHRVVGFAQHPAGRQEQHRPGQAGDAAGLEVTRHRHLHHAGDGRHERTDRADVARHQDALEGIAAEHRLAAVEQLRVLAEGPEAAQAVAPASPHPVADAIAGKGAERRAGHRIRTGDLAQADEHAHREQQRQRRHDRAQHDDRIAEGNEEDDRTGKHGVS
ncbi:hypothetical protein D3C71_1272060 [compost metagenome]